MYSQVLNPEFKAKTLVNREEKKASTLFLHGIRGLAALYVVVGHARWLLWEGYSGGYIKHPEKYTFFEKIQVYFFTSFKFGHEVVLLFFVLSGFVIHLSSNKFFDEKIIKIIN